MVQLNNSNEIIVDKYCATSKHGIFAAGNVTDVPYKQYLLVKEVLQHYQPTTILQKLKGGKSPPIRADWKSSTSSK